MDTQSLHAYCEEWRRWMNTRRYYVMPPPANILVRMMPHKVREAPDALLSADLQLFNLSVRTLVDQGDPDAECFFIYYVDRAKNIKAVAHKMRIGRATFYEKRDRFARKAYTLAMSFQRALEEESRLKPDTEED